MTKAEINKVIHELLMGECWHDLTLSKDDVWTCAKCPLKQGNYGGMLGDPKPNPDYCSDDSPRRLLFEPWRRATMRFGWDVLEAALAIELEKERVQPYAGPLTGFNFANATGEQLSRAIVACLENEKP